MGNDRLCSLVGWGLVLCLAVASCATTPPAVVTSACSWATLIIPDAGFETRLTANEKRQIDTYDRTVEKECPIAPNSSAPQVGH